MGKPTRDCPLCGDPLEDNPADHDVAKCEKTELLKGREQIKKLKVNLNEWKDAWFHCREIIGWLWWHHPAIDDDAKRSYYQANLRSLRKEPTVQEQKHSEPDCFLCGGLCRRDHD